MYYVPSADHAHASVTFIHKAVRGGALVRGLHAYGASAMIVLVVAHIAQTFLFGAYKQRRELVWIVGGLLLLLILAFAFTGYLLPWELTSPQGSAYRLPAKCRWLDAPFASVMMPPMRMVAAASFVGHIIFGLKLGAVFVWLHRPAALKVATSS
jgi:cytochrome b/b6/petB-like protein